MLARTVLNLAALAMAVLIPGKMILFKILKN